MALEHAIPLDAPRVDRERHAGAFADLMVDRLFPYAGEHQRDAARREVLDAIDEWEAGHPVDFSALADINHR